MSRFSCLPRDFWRKAVGQGWLAHYTYQVLVVLQPWALKLLVGVPQPAEQPGVVWVFHSKPNSPGFCGCSTASPTARGCVGVPQPAQQPGVLLVFHSQPNSPYPSSYLWVFHSQPNSPGFCGCSTASPTARGSVGVPQPAQQPGVLLVFHSQPNSPGFCAR